MRDEIKNIVKMSYSQVPMYCRIREKLDIDVEKYMEEDRWDEIPIVEKNMVVSSGVSALAPWAIPQMLQDKLISARTSGSTGKYMEIYWNESDYKRSMLPLWYYRSKYYGICPDDKLCFFYTIHQVGEDEEEYFYNKNSLGFSKSNLSMERLMEIYKKIEEYRPKWLMLQPSMAVLLCECMDKYGLDMIDTIEYIEFSGEILTDSVREMTAGHFNCKTANQYGANEFNSIAYECPWGHMHILKSNVYVEEDGKEEDNELIVTTLSNRAMPLIRYRIGDKGKIRRNIKCPCGNEGNILELNSGRANDFIQCENGGKKSPYGLVRAVEAVNYMLEGVIKQFQIEQTDIGVFIVRLVADKEDEMYDEGYIEEEFLRNITDRELRNGEYRFEYYGELFPDEATGKYKYFVKSCK